MEPSERIDLWVRSYDKQLLRLAYAYVRNWTTAQDVVQMSFVKAYHAIHHLRDRDNPLPWLSRIVINECISTQRKERRDRRPSSAVDAPIQSAEETVMRQDDTQHLHDSIMTLPEKLRVPIILYYFNELAIHEISAVTGLREGTIKSRLSRARERLKGMLRGDEGDEDRTANPERKTSL